MGLRALAIDSGTTTTRVWAMEDEVAHACVSRRIGARDRVRGDQLLAQVRELADEALTEIAWPWSDVAVIVAFGMITSEFGVEEIPHIEGPVSVEQLGATLVERHFAARLPCPVLFVPGVKWSTGEAAATDFMRGEETEVVGLLAAGYEPPLLYVSPGSHTKFIAVDDERRIAWSFTTLSGELLWALARETILAEIVDAGQMRHSADMIAAGAQSAATYGLSRSLYTTRLMNRLRGVSPAQCSSYVTGAIAGADLRSLEASSAAMSRSLASRVVLQSGSALADAYAQLLDTRSWVEDLTVTDEPFGPRGAMRLVEAHRPATPGDAD